MEPKPKDSGKFRVGKTNADKSSRVDSPGSGGGAGHLYASDYAIGASLEQRGKDGRFHPLGFFSRHLSQDKQKWSTYRKELFACVQGLRHFLPDFYGRPITIYSDHMPLTKSFQSNTLQSNDPVAQRQLVEIGMFTKEVKYLPAGLNVMADWLSMGWPF